MSVFTIASIPKLSNGTYHKHEKICSGYKLHDNMVKFVYVLVMIFDKTHTKAHRYAHKTHNIAHQMLHYTLTKTQNTARHVHCTHTQNTNIHIRHTKLHIQHTRIYIYVLQAFVRIQSAPLHL